MGLYPCMYDKEQVPQSDCFEQQQQRYISSPYAEACYRQKHSYWLHRQLGSEGAGTSWELGTKNLGRT